MKSVIRNWLHLTALRMRLYGPPQAALFRLRAFLRLWRIRTQKSRKFLGLKFFRLWQGTAAAHAALRLRTLRLRGRRVSLTLRRVFRFWKQQVLP